MLSDAFEDSAAQFFSSNTWLSCRSTPPWPFEQDQISLLFKINTLGFYVLNLNDDGEDDEKVVVAVDDDGDDGAVGVGDWWFG